MSQDAVLERLLAMLPTAVLVVVNAAIAELKTSTCKTVVLMMGVDDDHHPEAMPVIALLLLVEHDAYPEAISSSELERVKRILRDEKNLPGVYYVRTTVMVVKMHPHSFRNRASSVRPSNHTELKQELEMDRLLALLPTAGLVVGELPTSNSIGGIVTASVAKVNAAMAKINTSTSKTHLLMMGVDDEDRNPQRPSDMNVLALLLVVERAGQVDLISNEDLEEVKSIVRDERKLPGLYQVRYPQVTLIKLNMRRYSGPLLRVRRPAA